MSKTAQRKRDAYSKGYRAGRHGDWNNGKGFSFPAAGGVYAAFERGLADGRADRKAGKRAPWWVKALAWIAARVTP